MAARSRLVVKLHVPTMEVEVEEVEVDVKADEAEDLVDVGETESCRCTTPRTSC